MMFIFLKFYLITVAFYLTTEKNSLPSIFLFPSIKNKPVMHNFYFLIFKLVIWSWEQKLMVVSLQFLEWSPKVLVTLLSETSCTFVKKKKKERTFLFLHIVFKGPSFFRNHAVLLFMFCL